VPDSACSADASAPADLATLILQRLRPLSAAQALTLFELLRALTIELDHDCGELIYRAAQKQKRQHAHRRCRPIQLLLPLDSLDNEPF
jgi:hypothetical protein